MRGGYGGGGDAHRVAFRIGVGLAGNLVPVMGFGHCLTKDPHDNFLTPVAYDVALECGIVLGAVVGVAHHALYHTVGVCPIPFEHHARAAIGIAAGTDTIKQLRQQVAVPIDAIIDFASTTATPDIGENIVILTDILAGSQCESGGGSCLSQGTRDFFDEIAGERTAVVAVRRVFLVHLSGEAAAERHTPSRGVLDAIVYLKTFPVGVEVIHMHRIAMAVSCRVESFAIVVDHHVAIDDFVAPVLVHVGDDIVVVAVAIPV